MTNHEALLDELYEAVLDGQRDIIPDLVQQLLAKNVSPDVILYDAMIPAMDVVGRRFDQGEYFVPEMLVAAKAMQNGLNILRPLLAQSDVQPVARVAIGTVQGDIHDIGKNLVGMMWEGAGFEVVDLGINVPTAKFVEAAQNGAELIGISALLTTTMVNIPGVLEALADAGLREQIKIIVGGAPITQDFAEQIGADGYGANANEAVTVAKTLLGIN